jgi:hypothetical protein
MPIFPNSYPGIAELRGRPFAFVALTLGTWIGARILSTPQEAPVRFSAATKPISNFIIPAQKTRPNDIAIEMVFSPVQIEAAPAKVRRTHSTFSPFRPPAAKLIWRNGGRPSGLSNTVLVTVEDKPMRSGRDTPPTNAHALVGKAGTPELIQEPGRKWGVAGYTYSFWRFANGSSNALAPGAQYGGSQSGIILTVDPFGDPKQGVAVLARGAITPNGKEKELALGLRWKPLANIPVSLTAERRFQANAPDRFATYLAGGIDARPVIGKLKADGFAQAGFVSGKDGGGFFDVQAKLTHPLTHIRDTPITIGVGSRAGGQRDVARLDVGPTIGTHIAVAKTLVIVQLDWRMRIAGNARPKDGLALTLSSGF